jgi:cobyrinic acid a,c-diamide synthase
MCGVLPLDTQLQQKRKTLAYSDVSIQAPCHFGDAGGSIKGHRFHYSQIVAERLAMENWKRVYRVHHPRTEETVDEGYFKNNTLASYVHLHWASSPLAASSFIDFCRSKQ